jgi:hypothetical protein
MSAGSTKQVDWTGENLSEQKISDEGADARDQQR